MRALVGVLVLILARAPLPAQPPETSPELPASLALLADGSVELELAVPRGWMLYTDDPGPVGLPLRVDWRLDGRPLELKVRWPSGEGYATPAGEARVWHAPVRGRVAGSGSGPGRLEATVRWALCRADLCVPGVTRVAARLGSPPRPRSGGSARGRAPRATVRGSAAWGGPGEGAPTAHIRPVGSTRPGPAPTMWRVWNPPGGGNGPEDTG